MLITSQEIWKGHPCCVLVVDNRFLEAHPDKSRAIVRIHVKATEFINKNPREAAEIGVKYTGMDMKTVSLAMKNVNYTYNLSITGELEYVEFLSGLKYINERCGQIHQKVH